VMLTIHLHLMPTLRISGDISPLHLYATMAYEGKTLPLTAIIRLVTSDQSSKQEASYTIMKGQLQYRDFLLKFFAVATMSKPRMRTESVDVNFHIF